MCPPVRRCRRRRPSGDSVPRPADHPAALPFPEVPGMGDGFGHLFRRALIVLLLAGTSCLVVACASGNAAQPPAAGLASAGQSDSSQTTSASGVAMPAHAGVIRFDEDLD